MSLTIERWVGPSPEQWEMIIEGMRNPKNSWDRVDSYGTYVEDSETLQTATFEFFMGENDHDLAMRLAKGGPVHAKYRRMIPVWVDIVAPLYWWKEFDTYKVGTVANSCSTMHKIHAKEFTLDDFSHEHLGKLAMFDLESTIHLLNMYRDLFIIWDNIDDNSKNAVLGGLVHEDGYHKKDAWWQMIQLLPSSYNQKRTVLVNYEVLHNMYYSREGHKLDEWHVLRDWIEKLPYSEIITAKNYGDPEAIPTNRKLPTMDDLKAISDKELELYVSNLFKGYAERLGESAIEALFGSEVKHD